MEKSCLNVGIVNVWGSNRGDEAMQSALICFLNSLGFQMNITIYLNSWMDLMRYPNVYIDEWIRPKSLFPNSPNIVGFCRSRIGLVINPLLKAGNGNVLKHDFVISAPAGPYIGDMYQATEMLCLLPLEICKLKKIPYCILATSAGPFKKKWRNIVRREVLSSAIFWTVRESISLQNISELSLGIECDAGSDLAFIHPKRQISEYCQTNDEFREFESVMAMFEKRNVIIVVLNTTPFILDNGKRIIFEPRRYCKDMGLLLQHVIDSTGCHIMIFPHFYGNSYEQMVIKGTIHYADRSDRVHILHPFFNCEVQMHLYSKAAFAITHRYHPAVFASKEACPFLCIRHQFKVDGMLNIFGNPGPVVRTNDPVYKWIDAFDEAWKNKEKIKKQLQDHLPTAVQAAQKHLDILYKHLVANAH